MTRPARRVTILVVAVAEAVALWLGYDRLMVPFLVDPGQPFVVELGRGSGMFELNTVRVDQDGTTTLHRQRDGSWETATLRLPPDGVNDVVTAVRDTRLLGLRRAYHAGVHDGTQWVLRVRQGGFEKSVYCDNEFPRPVKQFAERLDAILAAHGVAAVAWKRVPDEESGRHDRELWESIER